MPEVCCPNCRAEIVAEVKRPGRGQPIAWMRSHPTKRNWVQVYCPECKKVFDWERKRLTIFDLK